MSRIINLEGQRFGRWTVLHRMPKDGGQAKWFCRCDCGTERVVRSIELRRGNSKSCGCLQREITSNLMLTHGKIHTNVYHTWSQAKGRCYNKNNPKYPNYGGRGIKVCEDWKSDFQKFYDYVSKLPHFGEKGYTLDRIDVNGNYEPENVRWADTKTQSRNRTDNHFVDYKDKKITIADAAKIIGISPPNVLKRIKMGDTGDRLFRRAKENPKNVKLMEFQGELLSVTEISRRTGVNKSTLYARIKRGIGEDDLFNSVK